MRSFWIAALLVSGLMASAPAVAQVYSPGPVYYNSSPGTGAPVYDPSGPVYYNQSGAIPPGAPQAMVSANPPYIPAPQGMVSANPPYYNQPPAMVSPNPPYQNAQHGNGGRWGGSVNGRWWGGVQAPGGWNGYRRPSRGRTLPSYWMTSNFGIPDYYAFGLRAPGQGYFWVRYYDDAVLVDNRGRVWDSVSGIAWAGASASAYAGRGRASASSQAYASAGGGYRQPIRPVDPNQHYGYPGGYAPPVAGGPPAVQYQGYPPCPNSCPNTGTYYGGSSHYGSGYYYGPSTTTTIVIQPATTITTTTIEEEVYEERVVTTYVSRPKKKRVYRPKPRPKPRQCGCQCVCR